VSAPGTFPPEFGVPAPPSAVLLGWSLRAMDAEAGTIEVGFDGKPEFANPAGFVQGGILAAMIDDAMGPIVAAHTRKFPSTIDLHTHYLRPVRPGAVTVKARISQAGRSVIFLTAELFDSRGKLSATGSASAQLTDGVFPHLEAGGPDA
jgi:uncharacterized protein (TIGR00369 family)